MSYLIRLVSTIVVRPQVWGGAGSVSRQREAGCVGAAIEAGATDPTKVILRAQRKRFSSSSRTATAVLQQTDAVAMSPQQ